MSAPLAWKLKDTHDNAEKLQAFFNRPDVLCKDDFGAFVEALIGLLQAKTITVEGQTYAYTSTLFNEALFNFIDHHFRDFDKAAVSGHVATHIALITVAALRNRQVLAVGELYVVTIPMTQFTFRLRAEHLPLVMSLVEQTKNSAH